MTERFEIKGLWFLPSNKDKKVSGVLRFDPVEGSYLELIGSLDENISLQDFNSLDNGAIILGTSVDSESITLYHCYLSSREKKSVRNEIAGPIKETFFVNFILNGYHFENEESFKFNTIASSLQNFDEWLDISGFQIDHEKTIENLYSINYIKPKDIQFDLHENHNGKFTFHVSRPHVYSQKHEYIIQEAWLELNSRNEIGLQEIRQLLNRFQNFLTMGVYQSVYPQKIILYNNNLKNDFGMAGKYRKPIKFYYSSSRQRKNKKEKHSFEMLFNYTKIKDVFPLIIKNWFENYDRLSPAFNLLFDQFYNGAIFNENTFLNLAQSAETLHSRIYDHTKIPKEEYEAMKKEILEKLPQYHSWMKEQLHFGNHLDLSQRLTELTEKYSNEVIDKIIPEKSNFVSQVKNLRNYYTHYSKSLEKKVIPERDLLFLSERLKMLLVSGFLFEIGIPKELSNTLFKNASPNLFRHLLP